MKKARKAQSLPVNTIIIVVIALVVLVLIILFFSMATGKSIFPALTDKIKNILGLWNSTKLPA